MGLQLVDVFGALGNSFAIIFFLLPGLMIYSMCKSKDTSKVPSLMFIFTLLNCEFWFIYGLLLHSWAIWACNGIGIFTNLIYYISYVICKQSMILLEKIILIVAVMMTFGGVFVTFYGITKDIKFVGGLACLMNILMFASPLQKIQEVYQKKDNTYIPINISICISISCICWICFGIFKQMDYFIIIPNVLGFCLSLFQIYLWCKFKSNEKNIKNVNNIKLEKDTNKMNSSVSLRVENYDLKS